MTLDPPVTLDPVLLAGWAGVPASGAEVLVERAGRVVARMDTAAGPAVVKADVTAGAFGPEVAAIGRLAAAGLPVPRVLAHREGPPGVLLLAWTPGPALSARSPVAAQRDAGRILRRVHGLGAGPPFSGAPTVDAWIGGWLDEAARWWGDRGGATVEQVAALRQWHLSVRPILAARPGGLILLDGRPEHFRVGDGRISGLIDLHDVGPGDPAMDLAVINLADPALTAGVLDGYQPGPDERAAFGVLLPFFTVLRALAAAEWGRRHGATGEPERMLARAARDLAAR